MIVSYIYEDPDVLHQLVVVMIIHEIESVQKDDE